jgi:hypothetical protein
MAEQGQPRNGSEGQQHSGNNDPQNQQNPENTFVASDVHTRTLSSEIKIHPLTHFESLALEDTKEDKALFTVLLQIKHSNNGNDKQIQYSYLKGTKKAQLSTPYTRMLTFACLSDPGRTIILLEKDEQDVSKHWSENNNRIGVTIGEKMLIMEPNIEGHMPSGQIIISTDRSLIHIIKPSVPTHWIVATNISNQLRYFVYDNCSIWCDGTTLQDSLCSGTLCDRQMVGKNKNHCGCYSKTTLRNDDANSLVMQCKLVIKAPHQKNIPPITVTAFRSLNFTTLFFENRKIPNMAKETIQSDNVLRKIRGNMKNAIKQINESDGKWTVIGWFFRGTSEDKEGGERLASEEIKYHIVRLCPTRFKIDNIPKLGSTDLIDNSISQAGNPNNNI